MDYIRTILHWSVNRIGKLSDLFNKDLEFIWIVPRNYDTSKLNLTAVENFKNRLQEFEILDKDELNVFLKEFSTENGIKYGEFMKTLRTVLSGLMV